MAQYSKESPEYIANGHLKTTIPEQPTTLQELMEVQGNRTLYF